MPRKIKPSKELKAMQEEEVTAEAARLLADYDLEDPKTQLFLARMARLPRQDSK